MAQEMAPEPTEWETSHEPQTVSSHHEVPLIADEPWFGVKSPEDLGVADELELESSEDWYDARLRKSQQIQVIEEWITYYDKAIDRSLEDARGCLCEPKGPQSFNVRNDHDTPTSELRHIKVQASRDLRNLSQYIAASKEWREKLIVALKSPEVTDESEPVYLPRVCPRFGPRSMRGAFAIGPAFISEGEDTQLRAWRTRDWMYPYYSGHERLANYSPGGLHPVTIGEKIKDRYSVVHKLGQGGYAVIWLVYDEVEKAHVAVKIARADIPAKESECRILRDIADAEEAFEYPLADEARNSVIRALDSFELSGPNGTHACYTMPVARCDLRNACGGEWKDFKFPLQVGKKLSVKIVLALAYLHSRGFVHGDLTLANVLVRFPPGTEADCIQALVHDGEPTTEPVVRRDGAPLPPTMLKHVVWPLNLSKNADSFTMDDCHILLSDFGESWSPATTVRLGKDCNAPGSARPLDSRCDPEVPLTASSDIWALAVIMWRLITGREAFDVFGPLRTEDITRMLGPLPDRWTEGSTTPSGDCEEADQGSRLTVLDACESKLPGWIVGKDGEQGKMGVEEFRAFIGLMREMWRYEPGERPTIQDVLKSKWFMNWGLPVLGSQDGTGSISKAG